MTDLPQTDDEEEDDEGPPSALSSELLSAKGNLFARCKAAGLEFEDKFLSGEETQYVRVLMKCGREIRKVSLFSEAGIQAFTSIPFEKYTFLSGLEAICSYELGTIEAGIRQIPSPLSSIFAWRQLFAVSSDDELKSAKISLSSDSGGLPPWKSAGRPRRLSHLYTCRECTEGSIETLQQLLGRITGYQERFDQLSERFLSESSQCKD